VAVRESEFGELFGLQQTAVFCAKYFLHVQTDRIFLENIQFFSSHLKRKYLAANPLCSVSNISTSLILYNIKNQQMDMRV
jgi:hypothetical protein